MQTPDACGQFVGRTAASGALNGFNRLTYSVDAIANGVGEIAVEEEKLKDSVGSEIGCVDLTIRLERRATAQQADLLKVLVACVLALVGIGKSRLVHLKQGGNGVGTLEIAAETNEMPSLTVKHRGVCDAFKEVDAIDDRGKSVADAGAELGLHVRRVHLVIEPIETLPLFGGDFFAHLAGVFAGSIYAVGNGGVMHGIENEAACHRIEITVPFNACRIAQGCNQKLPAGFGAGAAGVEHQVHGHVELANGILRPLKVAAHPVEAIGNAAKHRRTLPNPMSQCDSRTHVSLLPPPCDELTTREPFSRA